MPGHTPQQTADTLPGWVSTFYVTSGGKKSGPYHARCWKKNGKLKKEYIKAADLDRVRAACENHRQKRLHHIELSKQLATVTGNLNFLIRILKRSENRNRIPQVLDSELRTPSTP